MKLGKMFYMYYRVIDIIWLLLLASIPKGNYGQKISCYGDRPFKTKDIECADFSEVCIKQNDPECKSFLDTCKQCPITNTTVRIFLGLLKSSKDGLEKKIDDSVRQQKAVEEQLNHKIASLQRHGISILVLLIIIIFIAISVIIFKLIKRKSLFGKRKNEPNHRFEMSNQTNEYEVLDANPNDSHVKKRRDRPNRKEKAPLMSNAIDTTDFRFLSNKVDGLVNKMDDFIDRSKSVITFQVHNEKILIYVTNDDNVVQIKRQICVKCIDGNLNYKKMQLKYKNRILDDNQYLLSNVESTDNIVQCEINDAINPSDMVVLKVHGNTRIPSLIQANRNQTIAHLKKILSSFNNSSSIKVFKEKIELNDEETLENCSLKDNDSIQVIWIEKGHLIIQSILEDADPILIGYSNVDLVSSVKKKLSDRLTCLCDEILLYCDTEYLVEGKFIFEFKISRGSYIEYWPVLKFDRLRISGEAIENGLFSNIFKATDTLSNKDIFIKTYEFKPMSNWKASKSIVYELRKYKFTNSYPGFVQLGEFYCDKDKLGVSTEYFGQSMMDCIKNISLPENEIAKCSQQILRSFQVLHKQNVVYHDLKLSDILLDATKNIKISGFGLSKYLLSKNDSQLEGLIQKPSSKIRYPIPEVMNKKPFELSSDVWSFGAILYKMVTGRSLQFTIGKTNWIKLIENNKKIDLNINASDELQNIIKCCLKTKPDRPTVDELLENRFMKMYGL